jgi:RNA polymerase sigma-70 factor (ECF subfamily)
VAATRDERFERIYEDHFQRVAAYLLARSDREVAQDALARTVEIAWRRIDDIPDDSLPWLFGVARKVLADLRRSQGRADALFERMVSTLERHHETPDHADAATDRLIALDAFRSLPSSDREALLLIAWDGLTEKQAARSLGCSRGALAIRLHRARGRLKNLTRTPLADEGPPSTPSAPADAVQLLPARIFKESI